MTHYSLRYLTLTAGAALLALVACAPAALPPLPEVEVSAFPEALRERLRGELAAADAPDAAANRELGLRLYAYELYDAAAMSLRRAAEVKPDATNHYLAGSAWLAAGDARAALDAFAKSAAAQASARVAIAQGAAWESLGDAARAAEHYRGALTQRADHPYAHWRLGQLALEDGALDQAVVHLQQALTAHGDFAAGHYALAQAFARQGDVDRARQHQEAFAAHRHARLHRDPAFSARVARYLLSDRGAIVRGQQLFAAGQLEQAVAAYEQALAINPDNANTHTSLVGVYTALREVDGAKRHFEAATRIAPKQARAYFNYGRALANAGRWEEARELVAEAVRLQPNTVEYRLVYGSTLGATDRLTEAAAQFRIVADGDTSHALAHTNLVRVLGALEDDEAVLALIEKGRAGSRPLLSMLLAHAQTLAGRATPTSAITWLREAQQTPQAQADADLSRRIEARIAQIEALAADESP